MSSANEEDDDDNRLKPYKGERGGTFRTFRRDFLAQARGKLVNMSILRVWGCKAIVPMPDDKRSIVPKTTSMNLTAINLGFSPYADLLPRPTIARRARP